MYLLVTTAFAHGPTFGAAAVSVLPEDPREMWILTEGWGVAHTVDGGGEWAWICEEALGGEDLYAVLATAPGEAVVATRTGLVRVDGDCGASAIPGPEGDTFFPGVARYGGGFLGLGIGEKTDGVWLCDTTGCVATELQESGMFPKSAVADGDVAWVTVVYEDDLAAELWRGDGESWEKVYTWPDGDTDPRLLEANGDHLVVFRRTRSEDDTPEVLVSDDGGASWSSTLEVGYFTDATPGWLKVGDVRFIGTVAGARTWRSDDAGATWTEVSTAVPAVRCGDSVDGVGWACGDHLQDGFDLSRTEDGGTWYPVACLEQATVPTCAEASCAALEGAWDKAGAYGGGECDTVIQPPDPVEEDGCGCQGDAAWILGVFAWGRRRR